MRLEMPATPVHATPLAQAIALHQQGRLQEADACYASILAKEPGNVVARYNQGLARLQRGDLEGGMAALRKLLNVAPDHVEAHFNLGRAYLESGRAEAALAHFERVAALAPAVAEGHFYLGLALAQLGRHAKAVPRFEQAIALNPGLVEAHLNLGNALNETGRFEAARPCFERALALRPGIAEAHNGLGNVLLALGRPDEAGEYFQRAIALRSNYAEPYLGLGMVLHARGRYGEAAQQFKQAILIKPDFVSAFVRWGYALHEMRQFKAARACWEKVIEFEPERAEAYAGLGAELRAEGEHALALARFQQALSLDASNAQACNGLGNALLTHGQAVEGLAYLEKAVEIVPEAFGYQSNLLFNLHYLPGLAARDIAERHRAFGERVEAPLKPCRAPHANVPDPERTLRVGFVSGDFWRHPVGFFMADLLAGLNETGLELYAYANQWLNDDLTDRVKPMFKGWCACKGLNDDDLAAQVRADGIDILVDLSGHTENNRLLMFAHKPAPVQVTYLGYPDTTGLSAIDYLLGDSRMFPESEEALYVEKPWRLPDTSLCFTPPELPVEVGILPAMRNGFVTFGCLNKAEKVSDAAVETWAKILHAVPGSRLVLQNKPYGDAAIATHMHSRFAAHGIEADRLDLIGALTWQEHMDAYNKVDIALDPFPYNGTTTSIEGLWMGVPLLALKGDRLVAHMGESILHAAGMPEWIATDEDDYVARAVAFASALRALADVRAGLRLRLLASPICDAPRFASNLEAAFWGMWRKWCDKG